MNKQQQKVIACGALVLALVAYDKTPAPPSELAQPNAALLQARLATLTRAVENAEAIGNIKRLQWAYGHYSELGLWYDFADLFAEGGIGHYVQGDLNKEQIRALFFEQVGQGQLGLAAGRLYPHISFSPVVTMGEDGASATARFRILAMLGGYGGNATWFHGLYENAYVREQGIWKLNELSNTGQITGNFKTGLTVTASAPLDVPAFPMHFVPGQVGKVVDMPRDVASDAGNAAMAMQATLSALQQRLLRLQDEAAITRLQHQYGYYLDEHNWTALAELFAEQGRFETDQRGVYIGKTSIVNALNQFGVAGGAPGMVDEHILFQTYVSVAPDGLSAKARLDQLGMRGQPGASAAWTQGIYENTFVKVDGQWRIESLHYYPRLITDYDKGWAEDAQPAPGPSADYPPDAPPTERYAIFPEFYIPPFHFTHPVTGRAPQYPPGTAASGPLNGFAAAAPPTSTSAPTADLLPLPVQLEAAEAQAQQALGVDAVENLINAYAYYLDECLPQQAAALFAEDGVNEIAGVGFYEGPSRIANALQLAYCPEGRQSNALTLHHAVQPLITVADDGQRATVVSRLWQVHVAGDANDYYLMGRLEGEAIRQGDQWQLSSLSTHYRWVAAIEEGWARATKNAGLGYTAPADMHIALPPDRPAASTALAPYP